MSENTTTIQVSIENYKKLSGMKYPGDSFDDVIGRILNDGEYPKESPESNEHTDTDGEPDGTNIKNGTTQDSGIMGDEADEKEAGIKSSVNSEESQQTALVATNRLEEDVEQTILTLDPSTQASREKWIPAVREAYQYLKANKEASKQDFIDEVFPDERAGYDNEQTWWRKVIRPSLTSLRDSRIAR